jgi:hypothetical protein
MVKQPLAARADQDPFAPKDRSVLGKQLSRFRTRIVDGQNGDAHLMTRIQKPAEDPQCGQIVSIDSFFSLTY